MNKKIFPIIILMITIIILTSCSSSYIPSSASTDEFVSQFDKSMAGWMEYYSVPGAAVAFIDNGKIVWQKGYGYADKEKNIPVNVDTVFRVASLSKPLTSWGVMKLVQEKKIKLDDSVEKYLTRWHLPNTGFNNNEVTIRRLLSHTAGLSVKGSPGHELGSKLPVLEQALNGDGRENWRIRVIQKPGESFMYSGRGYTILQLLIEEVTKENFDVYMKKEIFDVLDLRHTRYNRDYEKGTVIATSYDGKGIPIPDKLWIEHSSGGMYTTISDFSQFVLSCMKSSDGKLPGREIISPKTLELMYSPAPNTAGQYGMGFIPETLDNGQKLILHTGNMVGWNAQMAFMPDTGKGFIIFTNTDKGFCFKSYVLGVWSKWAAGDICKDTKGFNKIQNIIIIVTIVVFSLLLFFILFEGLKIKRGNRRFRFIFKQKLTAWQYIKLILPILTIVVWYTVCYSEMPLGIILEQERYYLFTFLPPEFKHLTNTMLVWMGTLFLLNFFPKINQEDKKSIEQSVIEKDKDV